jgi:prepilin-type N-terminal cleavage/methylation domain-containing protein
MSSQPKPAARGAFSLIELLVVIAIIALVIAIIVPALAGARLAAKKASTTTLMSQVTSAAEQFSQDHSGALPGYYAPNDMGSARNINNAGGGFTQMENVLLDLIGRDSIIGEQGPQGSGGGGGSSGMTVGPSGGGGFKGQVRNVIIDPNLLGTGDGVYLTAGADNLQAASGQVGSQDHQDFPDLVDAFGNPILAWVEDRMGPREPTNEQEFATDVSQPDRARFYWASNAGWLRSTGMGKGGQSQVYDSTKRSGSLLGDMDYAAETLTAFLGNPNFPTPTVFDANSVLPSASRGAFIVHSAGADGVFLGVQDHGASELGINSPDKLEYALNFFTPAGQRLVNANGTATTIDLAQGFDDLMATAGN